MKGLSVKQVDISGALESACECRDHTLLLRTHTLDSVVITSEEQKKEGTGREESRGN